MFTSRQFFIGLSLACLIQTAFAEASRLTIEQPGLQTVTQNTLVGKTDPSRKIDFMVWLKLRNKTQMDQLAHDIYDPKNPRYHHFMTKTEFENWFAPTPDIKQLVQQYFLANGMDAEIIYDAVHVKGNVKQIEKLFNVSFNNYIDNQHYSIDAAPTMDAAIGRYVLGITGLTNISRYHAWNSQAMAVPSNISFNGFNASTLRNTYQVVNIAPVKGATIDGTGQTMVIIDELGLPPSQVIADANNYGSGVLPPLTSANFIALDQYGNACTTQCSSSGTGIETGLDVESSHTLAPGANIVLLLGTSFDAGLITAIETLIHNNYTIAGFTNAYQISNSWGGLESANAPLETYLQAASMSGVSVNFSSGDCADGSVQTSKCTGLGFTAHTVSYPASSTYVTAVGATAIFVDTNWNYAFEVAWGHYDINSSSFTEGTMGGISQYYGPASWQSSISNFNAVGYTGGTIGTYNKRAIPDVAMLGDPQTGLRIIVNGQVIQEGGTSLACPLFTAVIALTHQARALTAGGQNPIGQVAPLLYNNQVALVNNGGLNLVIPPHTMVPGAIKPTTGGAPFYSFSINSLIYGWDTSLGIIQTQFWNDEMGLGSVNVPQFVALVAGL